MNPKSTPKKGTFLCGCCATTEEDFDSNEVIFECFGKEFTEYEYVIENLAIRPAPKKLLDLVPVHSTNISKKSIYYKVPIMETHSDEHLHKPPSPTRITRPKPEPSEHGDSDCQKPESPILKLRDLQKTDDFVSLKILPDEAEPRLCGPCNLSASNYNPCTKYPYDKKPCGSCKVETFPDKCKPVDSDTICDVMNLRRTLKSREYRTTKQILADLCEASEKSLRIQPKKEKPTNQPIPVEIKNTIEELKFKKPLPQFYTRTERKPFHKPGIYLAVPQDGSPEESDNTLTTTGQQRFIVASEQQTTAQSKQQRMSGQSRQPRLSAQSDQPSSSGQSDQPRLSAQSGQPSSSGQSDQPRLSAQSGQPSSSGQSGQPRYSSRSGQSRQLEVSGQLGRSTEPQTSIGIELLESDITIDDLSENAYNYSKMPLVDSTAQTDISEKCPCPKKARKNLKWKIIINKHSNCKC